MGVAAAGGDSAVGGQSVAGISTVVAVDVVSSRDVQLCYLRSLKCRWKFRYVAVTATIRLRFDGSDADILF